MSYPELNCAMWWISAPVIASCRTVGVKLPVVPFPLLSVCGPCRCRQGDEEEEQKTKFTEEMFNARFRRGSSMAEAMDQRQGSNAFAPGWGWRRFGDVRGADGSILTPVAEKWLTGNRHRQTHLPQKRRRWHTSTKLPIPVPFSLA